MKKVVIICLALLVALTASVMMASCGSAERTDPDQGAVAKVVVNIEGTVTAVDGNEITLDSGKVVVISADTVFAGDPDTDSQVSDKIAEGNFIQGYTSDDLAADKVEADRIYTNEIPQRTGGKIVINFEGTVVSVDENSVKLDNGQTVVFDSETVFTDVNGTVENVELSEGDYIQGYTADEPSTEKITARRVHIVVF